MRERMKAIRDRFGIGIPVLALVTLLALIAAFPASAWLAPFFDTGAQRELTGIVINGVLTVVLVFAYLYNSGYQRQLTNVQNTQTDIQEKQREAEFHPKVKLIEFKHRPALSS